ncbi:MAG: penicillin-binding protein 2, partial [Actinobacteria bacterium]|nr:penicillin-binding protein 2 [Actinomycetota bacterium]
QARRRTRNRLLGFVIGSAVLVTCITARLVDTQVTGRSGYQAYGAERRNGYRVLPAGRGAIYDRSGQAFALSVARPNVVADPTAVHHPVGTARKLAPVLHADVDELAEKLRQKDTHYQVLAPLVSDRVAAKVKELDLEGISFEDQYVRQNPSDGLARAVVGSAYADGTVGADGEKGRTGVERAYERQLEGTPGRLTFEKDRWGNTIADTAAKLEPAKPGTDLYLTLDQSLQYATEDVLADQVAATGAEQGMAIIMRPSTGEVLAMASVAPDEDGKVSGTGDNRPVSTVFEPGSVNKMITVAGAMEEGLVDPDTPITVPYQLLVGDHWFSDHDPHGTATWSPTDILVTSSNIGTIKIAQMLGKEKVDGYLRAFGLGSSSKAFPGEVNGFMTPLDQWSATEIGAVPIGQGIAVTALQMLGAYNVIANDGVYVAPRLIAATDSGDGKEQAAASKRHRVVSPETATALRRILAKVVTDGTGKRAAVPGYVPFGKTGTARIPQPPPHADPKDAYQDAEGRYHYESSFVGGVDGADLSIIVTIQDAKTSIFGGDVSAPVFAHLASLTLRHEQIPPPALLDASAAAVPELSASARELGDGDPGPSGRSTQG